MRTFLNGDGVDVTSATKAYLLATDTAQLVDLFLIGDIEDPLANYITSWDTPLLWGLYPQIFQKTVISRGEVSSQVSLKVDSLQIEWSPQLTAFGTTMANANIYQRALAGFYDNQTFKFFRGVLNPAKAGDINTYGACVLFGGRIGPSQIQRGKIIFTVNSFLDVIDQMIPPNVIELNNTLAQYAGATPVVVDAETNIPQFTTFGLSNNSIILGTCTGPTPGKIYGTNKFRYGYLVFNAGSANAGRFSPIAASGDYNDAGTHYNQFTVLAPFPFPPVSGDTFYCSTQPPINLQDAVAGFDYFGFPYVPQPESAA